METSHIKTPSLVKSSPIRRSPLDWGWRRRGKGSSADGLNIVNFMGAGEARPKISPALSTSPAKSPLRPPSHHPHPSAGNPPPSAGDCCVYDNKSATSAVIDSVDDSDQDSPVKYAPICPSLSTDPAAASILLDDGQLQQQQHQGPEEATASTCQDYEKMCCRNCGSTQVIQKRSSGGDFDTLRSAAARSGLPVATCKLLVVGNAKCGKTSVIRRFVESSFNNAYVSTVGADYLKRDVVLKDGRPVRLQLWDIAGQDRFVHLTRAYFSRAKGVLVVCDLTREKTFEAVKAWKQEIDEWAQMEGSEGIPVVLIANKCDMLTDASESFLAGANMVKMCHEQRFASWYVTSAKSGSNVESAFLDLVERAVEHMTEKDDVALGLSSRGGSNSKSSTVGPKGGFRLSSGPDGRRPEKSAGAWSMC